MENNINSSWLSGHRLVSTIVIVVTLILFIGAIVLLKKNNNTVKSSSKTAAETQSKVESLKSKVSGSLTIRPEASKTVFSMNETIPFVVMANSAGKSIAGYDVIVHYDSSKVALIKAQSVIPDFQSVTQNAPDKVAITGIKKLNVTSSEILSDTPIIQLTFAAKAEGKVEFSLEYVQGSTTDSNLMTDDKQSQDILGTVKNTQITIGK